MHPTLRGAFRRMRQPLRALAIGILGASLLAAPGAQAQQRIALIRDAEIETALRDWTNPILEAAKLDPAAVQIYVVNDNSLNAFVAGGQNIFFHTGLITSVKTPNELIGVIAHETGHISGGHLTRGSDAMANAAVPIIVSMIAGVALALAGSPDGMMGAIAGGQTIAERSFFAYTRSQESSADQAAVQFLTATQQSARGMLDLFGRMQNEDIMLGRSQDRYARSHPLSRERVAALQQKAEASPYFDRPDPARDMRRLQLIQAKIWGYMESPAATLRRFPRADQSEPARYARAVAYFRSSQFEASIRELDSLIAGDPSNPYFHELKGQLYVEMSRPADGIPHYARAVQLRPESAVIRVGYGAALLATEDPAHAQAAIDSLSRALREDPENFYGWRQLAIAYDRANKPGEALLSTAEGYFVVGAFKEAEQFAGRAQQRLEPGTISHRRATDILTIAQNENGGARPERRRN